MEDLNTKDTAFQRFHEHPVISTVLWILGHDMNKQLKRKDGKTEEKTTSLLSWKDDHGGHIGTSPTI
jgi:hypothetical protein